MIPTLFSVSYAGLWGQATLSLEYFIPHAAALGYRAVMLMGKRPHLSPLDWDDTDVKGLRARCDGEGVEVACVAAYTNFTGGAEAGEVPLRDMQVQYVESLCRIAQRLDCPRVRIFTSYERTDSPPAAQWNSTVAAIQECCERATAYDVEIGIQNHHDLAVHSKALAELLRDIDRPNAKLMFDPWSPALRGEDLFEAAKALAPHTIYTTLADYIRLPRYHYRPELINYERAEPDIVRAVPMGEGEIDSATFLRGLREGGFDGHVAYEMCSPLRGGGEMENLDHCARTFLDWMARNGLTD